MQLQTTVRISSAALFAWAIGGTSAFAADEPTITEVQVSETHVKLILDGPVEGASVSAFSESDPERAIVDMLGVSLGELAGQPLGSSDLVSAAELSVFSDDAGDFPRLTVSLTQPAVPTVEFVDGTSILLNLEVGASSGGLFAALQESGSSPASSMDGDEGRQLDSSRGVAEGPGTPWDLRSSGSPENLGPCSSPFREYPWNMNSRAHGAPWGPWAPGPLWALAWAPFEA